LLAERLPEAVTANTANAEMPAPPERVAYVVATAAIEDAIPFSAERFAEAVIANAAETDRGFSAERLDEATKAVETDVDRFFSGERLASAVTAVEMEDETPLTTDRLTDDVTDRETEDASAFPKEMSADAVAAADMPDETPFCTESPPDAANAKLADPDSSIGWISEADDDAAHAIDASKLTDLSRDALTCAVVETEQAKLCDATAPELAFSAALLSAELLSSIPYPLLRKGDRQRASRERNGIGLVDRFADGQRTPEQQVAGRGRIKDAKVRNRSPGGGRSRKRNGVVV